MRGWVRTSFELPSTIITLRFDLIRFMLSKTHLLNAGKRMHTNVYGCTVKHIPSMSGHIYTVLCCAALCNAVQCKAVRAMRVVRAEHAVCVLHAVLCVLRVLCVLCVLRAVFLGSRFFFGDSKFFSGIPRFFGDGLRETGPDRAEEAAASKKFICGSVVIRE